MEGVILFGPAFINQEKRGESPVVNIRVIRYPNNYLPVIEVLTAKDEWTQVSLAIKDGKNALAFPRP